jgi:hypothetical protein
LRSLPRPYKPQYMPANSSPTKVSLSGWSGAFLAVYAVTGHFLGKEWSPFAGFVLTPLGLALGFLLARQFAKVGLATKMLALCAPLVALAFVVGNGPKARLVNAQALKGTWTEQTKKQTFTLQLRGDSAWLSVEPGLKNVPYGSLVRHDSLVLRAGQDNQLRFGIIGLQNGAFLLDAGGGFHFKKAAQ